MKDSSIRVYNQKDVIESLNYSSPVERDILNDIISLFTSEAASGIENNKIVQIPYLFNIRKNLTQQEFSKKKKLLHLARSFKTKSEYKNFAKQVYNEAKEEAYRKDRLNVMIRRAKQRFKKKYELLVVKCGKEYADAWILSRCCFKIIPFDEDVEFALQKIWEEENET